MEPEETRVYRIAVRLLERGKPLPVDVHARLMEMNVDVSALLEKYDQPTHTEEEQ